MRFNDEKILEDADMMDICKKFDIKTVCRGSNTFISCPDHINRVGKADRDYDKCYIKKGHYYCFSCGASGNVIRLVQTTLGCSGYEARRQICESLGGVAPYVDSNYSTADEIPYNKKELEALGLHMVAYGEIPRCLTDDKTEIEGSKLFESMEARSSVLCLNDAGRPVIVDSGHACDNSFITRLYTGCSRVSANLRELYSEDKETFFWMIENKANEMISRYETMLMSNIAAKILPQKAAYYVNSIYRNYLGICKRIREEINSTKTGCIKKTYSQKGA